MSRIDQALNRAGLTEVAAPKSSETDALERFPNRAARGAQVAAPEAQAPDSLPASTEGRTGLAAVHSQPAPGQGAGRVFHGFSSDIEEKLVVSDATRAASVEQYRRLAAALHHAQADRGIRVIMVTSALPGEGKTLTSTNLALTLSESYRRSVLVIDADLRRPALHDVFQVPNVSGLSDGLRGDSERPLTVIEISPRLSLLPGGQAQLDPVGALTSDRMRRLVQEAATRYDWVILDTPPIGLLSDANLLSSIVDAAILVISAGQTPFAFIQKATAAIGRDRIIGVVLNRVGDGQIPGSSYYGGYYVGPSGKPGSGTPPSRVLP